LEYLAVVTISKQFCLKLVLIKRELKMRLLRFGEKGSEQPGILDKNGEIRDLSSHVSDICPDTVTPDSLNRIRQLDIEELPKIASPTRYGPCVGKVGKFICIGLNYADHAEESGMDIPKEPEIFTKATSSICGPDDDVIKPRGSTKMDWEVELGIVIGRHASYVNKESANDYIAGFCLVNDLSERSFQFDKGSQWDKGKGCDTFGPIGPWLVTPDEIADVSNLNMWLEVNGHRYQNGNTSTMIFNPDFIVSYVSQFMSLQPGDIISTGTPPGVGLGQKPPVYLNDGDVIQLGVDELGKQRQKVVSYE
jgi:2,4-didehydro-3-deoxy-L-rhamnonate hydrolase